MQENKKKIERIFKKIFLIFFLSGYTQFKYWAGNGSSLLNLERKCHLHAEFLHANGYVAGFKVAEGKASLLGRR